MAITRPYTEIAERTYTIADPSGSWGTGWQTSGSYHIAPVIDAGDGNEVNWHRFTATWTGGGTVQVLVARSAYPSPSDADKVGTLAVNVGSVTSGQEYVQPCGPTSAAMEMRYAWPIFVTSGTVTGLSVSWTCAKFTSTIQGHEVGPFTVTLAGKELKWRILFPRGYDSSASTTYPLVVSFTGDPYEGEDNRAQMSLVQAGRYFWEKWFVGGYPTYSLTASNTLACISVVVQIDDPWRDTVKPGAPYYPNGTTGQSLPPYWYGTGWEEPGWTCAAVAQLARSILSNSDYKVDTTKVYLTGFSRGAMMVWPVACQLRSVLAAVVECDGLVLGGNGTYSNWWHWFSSPGGIPGYAVDIGSTTARTMVARMRQIGERIKHLNIFKVNSSEILGASVNAGVDWPVGDSDYTTDFPAAYDNARKMEAFLLTEAVNLYNAAYPSDARTIYTAYNTSAHTAQPALFFGDATLMASLFDSVKASHIGDDPYPDGKYPGNPWQYSPTYTVPSAYTPPSVLSSPYERPPAIFAQQGVVLC
jgi:hypothetical protein